MKYFQIIFLIILFSIPTSIEGQEFAPIGSEWYYSEGFAFSGDIDYLMITSISDTIINGKPCRKLFCDDLCWNPSRTQFVYYSNDSLFFFDQELDMFQLIADFNAKKNDSWKVLVMDWDNFIDTVLVTVDSAFIQSINQIDLKTLNVTYTITDQISDGVIVQHIWVSSYSSQIIERIGDIQYLFNFPKDASMACDMNYSGGLRCYEDTVLGFYSTGIAESCTYTYKWTGIENNNLESEFKIYPNPTSDWIEIESKTNIELSICLIDLSGKIVYEFESLGSSRLNLTNLQKGFYVLWIKNSDQILGVKKIIKN